MAIGASCPWNLSTVPTLRPAEAPGSRNHLGVVGRDDEYVVEGEGRSTPLRSIGASSVRIRSRPSMGFGPPRDAVLVAGIDHDSR